MGISDKTYLVGYHNVIPPPEGVCIKLASVLYMIVVSWMCTYIHMYIYVNYIYSVYIIILVFMYSLNSPL